MVWCGTPLTDIPTTLDVAARQLFCLDLVIGRPANAGPEALDDQDGHEGAEPEMTERKRFPAPSRTMKQHRHDDSPRHRRGAQEGEGEKRADSQEGPDQVPSVRLERPELREAPADDSAGAARITAEKLNTSGRTNHAGGPLAQAGEVDDVLVGLVDGDREGRHESDQERQQHRTDPYDAPRPRRREEKPDADPEKGSEEHEVREVLRCATLDPSQRISASSRNSMSSYRVPAFGPPGAQWAIVSTDVSSTGSRVRIDDTRRR